MSLLPHSNSSEKHIELERKNINSLLNKKFAQNTAANDKQSTTTTTKSSGTKSATNETVSATKPTNKVLNTDLVKNSAVKSFVNNYIGKNLLLVLRNLPNLLILVLFFTLVSIVNFSDQTHQTGKVDFFNLGAESILLTFGYYLSQYVALGTYKAERNKILTWSEKLDLFNNYVTKSIVDFPKNIITLLLSIVSFGVINYFYFSFIANESLNYLHFGLGLIGIFLIIYLLISIMSYQIYQRIFIRPKYNLRSFFVFLGKNVLVALMHFVIVTVILIIIRLISSSELSQALILLIGYIYTSMFLVSMLIKFNQYSRKNVEVLNG